MTRPLLPALLLAAGCATAVPPVPPAPAPAAAPAPAPPPVAVVAPVRYPGPRCPDEGAEFLRCMARLEARAMAEGGGRVSRAGDSLVIRGEGTRRLALVNVKEPEERTLIYRYHGFALGIGQHVVEMGFYEGRGWLLVDARTTEQTHVLGPPVASPGRTRFATASLDLVAGYDPNGVQVWRMEGGAPRLEWEVRGGDTWGASDLAWRGEEALEFTRHEPIHTDPERTRQLRMRLSLAGPGLRIEPATP